MNKKHLKAFFLSFVLAVSMLTVSVIPLVAAIPTPPPTSDRPPVIVPLKVTRPAPDVNTTNLGCPVSSPGDNGLCEEIMSGTGVYHYVGAPKPAYANIVNLKITNSSGTIVANPQYAVNNGSLYIYGLTKGQQYDVTFDYADAKSNDIQTLINQVPNYCGNFGQSVPSGQENAWKIARKLVDGCKIYNKNPFLPWNATGIHASKSPFTVTGSKQTLTAVNIKAPPDGSGAIATGSGDIVDDCAIPVGSAGRWFACILLTMGSEAAEAMDGVIQNFLFTPTDQIFTPQMKQAWNTFRVVGVALILIAGLVMVISQAAGLELFDAYTVKKVLPRLLVAAIGIALSWPLLKIGVTFFNDLGVWAHDLILAPFRDMPANITGTTYLTFLLGAGTATYAFVGAAFLGTSGLLSLLGVIVLGLLIGLLVLAIRQLVILVAILMAPLAIAAYILPGTQKLWEFWKNTLLTALMMFPIIMAFIAAGKALAHVASATNSTEMHLLSVIVYFAPYFLLPFAFKLAGGLMATVFSIANDKSRGVFDKERKRRQEIKATRKGEFASGQRQGPRLVVSSARRSLLAQQGGLSLTKGGRARYATAVDKLRSDTTKKMLEEDANFSSADDDATGIAMRTGMTRKQAIAEYAARYKTHNPGATDEMAQREATTAIGRLESSMHAQIGTEAMQLAAYRAHSASNATWSNDDGSTNWEDINRTSKELMDRGLITAADAAQIIKSNPNRGDRSAVGFGKLIPHFDAVRTGGVSGTRLSQAQLEDEALNSARPGDVMHGYAGAVKAFMHPLDRRIKAAASVKSSDPKVMATAEQDVIRELAQMKSRYEQSAATSPEKNAILAEQLEERLDVSQMHPEMRQLFSGAIDTRDANNNIVAQKRSITFREAMESVSTRTDFTNYRREFNDQLQASMQAAVQQAAQQAPGSLPGMNGPGTTGPGPNTP